MKAIIIKYKISDVSPDVVVVEDLDEDPRTQRLISLGKLVFNETEERTAIAPLGGASGSGNKLFISAERAAALREGLARDLSAKGDDTLALFTDPAVSGALPRSTELSATQILGVLAIAGLQTVLPRVIDIPEDELLSLRDRLKPEREEYLADLQSHIRSARISIREGEFSDAWEYASFETSPKLMQSCTRIQRLLNERRSNSGWSAVRRKGKGILLDGMVAFISGSLVQGHPSTAIAIAAMAGMSKQLTSIVKEAFPKLPNAVGQSPALFAVRIKQELEKQAEK